MDKSMEEQNAKILVVDDDAVIRDFLKRFLNQKGYKNIVMASTGKEALKIATSPEEIRLLWEQSTSH